MTTVNGFLWDEHDSPFIPVLFSFFLLSASLEFDLASKSKCSVEMIYNLH